ncbi:hypothetical protein [Paenibacillus sp. FSL R5-0519]|uniref:hypothetical protein n=1 Tax=Paenibacillus sp. FSL R5-0519 TaxID=2921648 RepID=UPI0030D8A56B
MSIKRDINGYKVLDLRGGAQFLWAEEDNVLFYRMGEAGLTLTTDVDAEFAAIMEAWEHAVVERDRLHKELEEAIKILRFYSQQEHYIDEDPGLYASPPICQDAGQWARSFLVGQEGEGNQDE